MEFKNTVDIEIYLMTIDGTVHTEKLPAYALGNNTYEIISSPGIAFNIAKGDIVEILSREVPPKIIKRGGNICVQVYSLQLLSYINVSDFEYEVQEKLCGTLDGMTANNLAFTIPLSAGFTSIENLFDAFTSENESGWSYGNIYDEEDVPLNWWLEEN